jgi:hypothetical protein
MVYKYSQTRIRGWACPQRISKNARAYRSLAEHLKQKYGEDELKGWYFELWNEPISFIGGGLR